MQQNDALSDFYTRAKQKIEEAKDILILLPSSNLPESVAAGLALYSGIKAKYSSKSDNQSAKNVAIISSTPLTPELSKLPNANMVQQSVGTKNLVVTLNTSTENIEKVTTDDDQGKFNIIIETKPGLERLTQNDVNYSFRGISADLIITVGVFNQSQLGSLLTQEPKLLEGREIITFSHQFGSVAFGSININNPQASGSSEMVAKLFKYLKIQATPEITTNILAGIETATNNFTVKTNAETFSLAGWCLRNQAQRNLLTPAPSPFAPRPFTPQSRPFPVPGMSPIQQSQSPVTPPPFPSNPFGNFPRPFPSNPQSLQPTPPPSGFPPSVNTQTTSSPMQPFQPESQPNDDSNQVEPVEIEGTEDNQPQPQKDWYEPKVYRGGQNV